MSPEDVERCLELLRATHQLPPDDPDYLRIEQAAAHLRKTAKKRRRRARAHATSAHDRAVLDHPAEGGTLRRQRRCYVCREPYREPHPEYARLCGACGERSRDLRDAPLDLEGRRALVTGGRVKIGQAVVGALVDAGAEVHLTSRFPHDAARRMAAWPDADRVRERVVVHGLDFRKVDRVLHWLEELREGPPFDLVVNNAAQTVWRTSEVRNAWHRA
ncbi:MAG: SDR family NAD(P)-dependent oxidoreductase, partial [Myxococcota bacterium]